MTAEAQDIGEGIVPEVLTVEEAAEYLQISTRMLLAVVRAGIIPGAKIGRYWRFSRRQLLEWVEEESRTEMEDAALAKATEEAYDDPDNQERFTADEVKARLGICQ